LNTWTSKIKYIKEVNLEIREVDLVLFVRMYFEDLFYGKEKFLRKIKKFHSLAFNFLTGDVLILFEEDFIISMAEG